jgi:hypothetical protein
MACSTQRPARSRQLFDPSPQTSHLKLVGTHRKIAIQLALDPEAIPQFFTLEPHRDPCTTAGGEVESPAMDAAVVEQQRVVSWVEVETLRGAAVQAWRAEQRSKLVGYLAGGGVLK